MACDKKWAIFAVVVSAVVVVAIVVPIAVFRNTGQSNGELQDGGSMSPSNMFLQFIGMIQCTTKSNPLDYQGYGCHCGFFNGGKANPVDATDQCCMEHDACLDDLKNRGVCPVHAFITIYSVKIRGCGRKGNASITCKPHDQYSRRESFAAMKNTVCAEALCQCDRTAAMCFGQHELQNHYKLLNKDKALCGNPNVKPGTGTGAGAGTGTGAGTGAGTGQGAGPTVGFPPVTDRPFGQTTMRNAVGTGGPAPIYRVRP